MATADQPAAPAPPRPRGLLRTILPWLVLLLIGAAAAVYLWPNPDFVDLARNLILVWALLPLLAILVTLWWLLSDVRRPVKFGVLLALVIGLPALFRFDGFDGNLTPIFSFRWTLTRDQRLEADRARRTGGDVAELAVPANAPADFPEYRNRRRDGVVEGPPLVRETAALTPARILWNQPCGGGYGSFAVSGNAAVTLEQRRDNEAVVSYDTATGRERWAHEYPSHFSESLGGDGPRTTPTVRDGRVCSLGAAGHLVCLELGSGKEVWSVNILEGNDNVTWGMSGSPLVYGQVVVVNPGAQRPETKGRALRAYDRASGKEVWAAGDHPAGYASPMLVTLGGVSQVVIFDGHGVAGHDAGSGRELWRHPWETQQGINVAQPLVLEGDRVFVSSGYGVGCALLQIASDGEGWTVKELWRNKQMRCRFTSPVEYQGFLYGMDEGTLVCLDAKTGQRKWKEGRYGNGQLLRSADVLVVLSEKGELLLLEATPEAHRVLATLPVLPGGKTWNVPSLAAGRAYVRNHEHMACVDLAAPTK